MTQQPPGPPYSVAPPAGPPPGSRPGTAGWFVGGGLVLLALACFVVFLVVTVSGANRTDSVATASPDGASMRVAAGEERMLFVPQGQSFGCRVSDDDGPVSLRPTAGSVTVGNGTGQWRGVGTFTSSTSRVEVSCPDAPPGAQVRVGNPLGVAFGLGIIGAVVLPLLLGLAGVVVLLVTLVRTLSARR